MARAASSARLAPAWRPPRLRPVQVSGGPAVGGLLQSGLGDGFIQAAAVAGCRLRHVLGQVVAEMPPVGDLDCFRGALAGAVGVATMPTTSGSAALLAGQT